MKFNKFPQVMSFESVSVGVDKFKNIKNVGVWSEKEVSLLDLCSTLLVSAWGKWLEATLATNTLTP